MKKNSNKKINDPVFSGERELARWIVQTPLSVNDQDHKGDYIIDLVNKPVHLCKFYNDYRKKFPKEIYPTEFDITRTKEIGYPSSNSNKDINKFFKHPGYTRLSIIELKYFRRKLGKGGKIVSKPSRYNVGIEQCIGNLNFGIDIELWHFFDPNFSEDLMCIFKEQMQKDLSNYNLPIVYNTYRIKYGDKIRKFSLAELEQIWNNPRNPKSHEKHDNMKYIEEFIKKIIIDKSLFSWDDNERLIGFLKKRFGIEWAENANAEKTVDGKTLRLYFENHRISLKLNDGITKVDLKIDDDRTYEFIAKKEYGRIRIYDKKNAAHQDNRQQ